MTGYDLSSDAFRREDHHDTFARMRADDPVHRHADGYWCLTKHADVQAAARDTATFTVTQGFTLIDPADDIQASMMGEMLPGMDGERHSRHRRIVNRGFTPRSLRLIEGHLATKAKAIVDDVADRGSCEFVTDVAAKLPLHAICELVGVPPEDQHRMFAWGNAMTGIDDPNQGDMEAGITAAAELMAYAEELRQRRASDPRDDIMTKLGVAADDDDAGALTDAELALFFVVLVVAGNETTRNAMSNGMRAFATHPEQWHALQADPTGETLERAVEEVLRWSTPVHQFRRTATRDVEVRGRTIAEGDWVVLWFASGNRDEDVFADPFTFDIGRHPNDHVTFGGGGPHFCLGANLARMELRLMFAELASRLHAPELDGDVEVLRSNMINGVTSMPLRWKA